MEVENLSAFPADMLAVTGSRRLVSVVSITIMLSSSMIMTWSQISRSVKKIRLYDVDINDDDT